MNTLFQVAGTMPHTFQDGMNFRFLMHRHKEYDEMNKKEYQRIVMFFLFLLLTVFLRRDRLPLWRNHRMLCSLHPGRKALRTITSKHLSITLCA